MSAMNMCLNTVAEARNLFRSISKLTHDGASCYWLYLMTELPQGNQLLFQLLQHDNPILNVAYVLLQESVYFATILPWLLPGTKQEAYFDEGHFKSPTIANKTQYF